MRDARDLFDKVVGEVEGVQVVDVGEADHRRDAVVLQEPVHTQSRASGRGWTRHTRDAQVAELVHVVEVLDGGDRIILEAC